MSTATRPLAQHHATKVGGARPQFICAECLVLWPCVAAHRAVTRCVVCGRFWSEHTQAEYQTGCTAPRS